MNQTFNTTVDIPNGYEATGEYRTFNTGEIHLNELGEASTRLAGGFSENKAFILRRAWTPPAWLPVDNWVYNNSENWIITNREPRQAAPGQWPRAASGSTSVTARNLATLYGQTFTPPPEISNFRVYRL